MVRSHPGSHSYSETKFRYIGVTAVIKWGSRNDQFFKLSNHLKTEIKKLHPNSIWILAFKNLLSFFYLAILLIIFKDILFEFNILFGSTGFTYYIFLTLLTLLLSFIWGWLQYENYRYELTDNSLKKEHGFIRKKYTVIPYSKIQNVDIIRGPLARLLKISVVNIQTAGYSGKRGSEGKLPGVSINEAKKIQEYLMTKVSNKNQGL